MSIGSTLSTARERAGLTVYQVAAATRIRRTLVEQIEEDDYSGCGGDFYARGHIRNIAHVVGADPAPLLAAFDASHAEVHAPRASEVFESETAARPERRGPNWTAAMAAAFVLVVVYGIVQAVGHGSDGPPPSGRAGAGTSGTASNPGPTSTQPAPEQSSAVAQAPRGRVAVAVKATDRSWVQATTGGGKKLFEGILLSGQVKTFTAKNKVKLLVGNAGAVDLTVNGTRIGAPGKPGAVVRLEFGPQDPAAG